MYIPEYATNMQGVPYLSGDEIDGIGERLIADFNPDLLSN